MMKQYSLKSPNKFHKVGRIEFTYDKAFMGPFDRYSKFIPTKTSVFLMSNEDPVKLIENLKKDYRNAGNFKIIFNQSSR